jgi:hypothetical protein
MYLHTELIEIVLVLTFNSFLLETYPEIITVLQLIFWWDIIINFGLWDA